MLGRYSSFLLLFFFFFGGGQGMVSLVAQAGIELKTLCPPQYLVFHIAVYHQAWLQYNFIMV